MNSSVAFVTIVAVLVASSSNCYCKGESGESGKSGESGESPKIAIRMTQEVANTLKKTSGVFHGSVEIATDGVKQASSLVNDGFGKTTDVVVKAVQRVVDPPPHEPGKYVVPVAVVRSGLGLGRDVGAATIRHGVGLAKDIGHAVKTRLQHGARRVLDMTGYGEQSQPSDSGEGHENELKKNSE